MSVFKKIKKKCIEWLVTIIIIFVIFIVAVIRNPLPKPALHDGIKHLHLSTHTLKVGEMLGEKYKDPE